MMKGLNERELELLDRYVRCELGEGDRSEVEDAIARSDEWREEYDLRVAATEGSRVLFAERMRAEFERIDRGEARTGGKAKRRIYAWIGAAATVLLLIYFAISFWPQSFKSKVIAAYSDFPNLAYPIEKSGDSTNIQASTYQFYEMKEYERAIDGFEQFRKLNTRDSLYLGLCHLALNNNRRAEVLLKNITTSDDERWADVADWYLTWVEIDLGKADEAKQRLERISTTTGHRYQDAALELL